METPKITVNEALMIAIDSGKPDRMQSLNYMQYQYHRSVWYNYCKHYLNSV